MSLKGGDGDVLENQMTEAVAKHETIKVENEKLKLDVEADSILVKGNGLHGRNKHYNYSDNELLLFLLHHFQNEFMKSQFQGFKIVLANSDQYGSQNETMKDNHLERHDIVKELDGKLDSLNKELLEERLTQGAKEEALKNLRAGHSEVDMKALELSVKLAEAQQKMDQEIQDRDEKYSELDSKFNRLHKRAKQRIQDVQKEKDDLEAKFREVAEKAEHIFYLIGEVERLLPVIAILLQFSPEEVQKCQQAYRALGDVPPSPASDSPGSALSLFS